MDLLTLKPPSELIASRVREIRETTLRESQFVRTPNFEKIHDDDIARLFELYDDAFFDGWLRDAVARKSKSPLTFRLSPTMTRAGGKTIRTRSRLTGQSRYQIAIGSNLLFMSFGQIDREITVTGLVCHDRLAALQRIMEHEMLHLGELLTWNTSSCSAARFRSMAKNIFGHTDTKHELITPVERAFKEHAIRLG